MNLPIVLGVDDKFIQCLDNLRKGDPNELGGTNNRGQQVNISDATAITYELCTRACGSGSAAFKWSAFSQEFTSWLLPWLALVSQLPFGSEDHLENLISMLLTVGSPTLAAYSLALTVLNIRWIAQRFSSYSFPNTHQAVRILSSLQQSPLQINKDNSLLSSLIILPSNDNWWNELIEWLDRTHSWSISAVASIAWVIIAYVFTVINTFSTRELINGLHVGLLWMWLLPMVIGWLQISPKCNTKELIKAMRRVNNVAYVATSGIPVLASSLSDKQAVTLRKGVEDPLYYDENCTIPIYNYARFLSWVRAVEDVSDVFRAASHHAGSRHPVDPATGWQTEDSCLNASGVDARNRIGTLDQIEAYCSPDGEKPQSPYHRELWGPDVFSRIMTASCIALSLQWGTTGAAVVAAWFMPRT
ncbi:hypothetical protein H0H87_012351, partial [Tephrocybe sp. NHM501043]